MFMSPLEARVIGMALAEGYSTNTGGFDPYELFPRNDSDPAIRAEMADLRIAMRMACAKGFLDTIGPRFNDGRITYHLTDEGVHALRSLKQMERSGEAPQTVSLDSGIDPKPLFVTATEKALVATASAIVEMAAAKSLALSSDKSTSWRSIADLQSRLVAILQEGDSILDYGMGADD